MSSTAYCQSNRDVFDELAFVEMQVDAVTEDMYGVLGWYSDDTERIRKVSQLNIEELKNIKEILKRIETSPNLDEMKNLESLVITKLISLYDGIERENINDLKPIFLEISNLRKEFSILLVKNLKEYSRINGFPEDLNIINEHVSLIDDKEAKEKYVNAVNLMDEGKFIEAYETFCDLEAKYKNTAFGDCVNLGISDCLLLSDSELTEHEGLPSGEAGLKILSNILNQRRYSPTLYEVFYKWRTVEQQLNHGMSNFSEIPNIEYNEKRWEVIQTIKDYLVNNPDDILAESQIDMLITLDNICRGGEFGNNNIMHWGYLYMN
jgi:hypothetical protein